MLDINKQFFDAYHAFFGNTTVYKKDILPEMQASEKDKEGNIKWKLIPGAYTEADYRQLEKDFKVLFPKSFICWHKSFFFLDAACSIINLPTSNPTKPLDDLKRNLDWFIPKQLIPQKIYPFGDQGNDTGPSVFDGRQPIADNEFPIRVYDHEYGGSLDGLSDIIFSSFRKLLECLTHYMIELKERKNFEIIPEFFQIDPEGAGKTGINYWTGWINMQKGNFELFG